MAATLVRNSPTGSLKNPQLTQSHDPATATTLVRNFPTHSPCKYGFITSFSKENSEPPIARKKQKGGENKQQPQRTYSAAAGSRPPNPSLVVDLAHMDFPDGSRPRPEIICEVLNKKLGEVTPPQSQLAAERWTAKGNLVITAGPSSSPVSLLTAT